MAPPVSNMVEVLRARNIDLEVLSDRFAIEAVRDLGFFSEWQEHLPEVTDVEKQFLDKVQAGFWNLITHPPLIEKAVQIAILGPILFLADFYLSPFHIRSQKSIEIAIEDEGLVLHGQLDISLLKDHFWIMAIESTAAAFSFEAGRVQFLTHMLANLDADRPGFGLIASGGSFVFLKLVKGEVNQYALSRIYETRNPGNELYNVYRIMKRIAQIA